MYHMNIMKFKQVKFLKSRVCMSTIIRLVQYSDNTFCKITILRRLVLYRSFIELYSIRREDLERKYYTYKLYLDLEILVATFDM